MSQTRTGIVTQSTGSWYTVRDSESQQSIECRIRGKLRLKGARSTNPVVVGDVVDYELDERGEAAITTIHPRHNYIIRRSPNLSKESHIIAANIDQALLVATLFSPTTSFEFIDRFLVTCEAYKIPATIILNKSDLACTQPEALAHFREVYTMAGYPILEVSALTGENIDRLQELLHNKTSLFSGNSGVGKSTLIKTIEPESAVRMGAISSAHNKGKHTTTFSTIYPLTNGGYIIDTPGIKGFGLIDISADELCRYFPDLMRYAPDCQYYNCTHLHEPGCAVEEALTHGKISFNRYESYLKILEEDEKHRK